MTPPTSREASGWLWRGALFLLIGIALIRIASTYGTFNHTYDEPAHLACGIEWLDLGTYGLEVQHPPLARILMAIGPYLNGSRSFHNQDLVAEGSSILYDRDYWRTLTLARIGMLPFFVLLCLMVWFWTKHLFGKPAALVAVLLVTNIPPLLGHAGVATTDIGVAAMLTAALFTLTLYLEDPSARRAGLLGLTLAGAVMSKFSSVAFFPVSLAGFILVRAVWHTRFRLSSPRVSMAQLLLCFAVFGITCWSFYRFSLSPVVLPQKDLAVELKASKLAELPPAVLALLEKPIPGGQMLRGLGSVSLHNDKGHGAYLFGEHREKGWWYFFEVVLAFKTPLAFLVISGLGAFLLVRGLWRTGQNSYRLAPLVFACSILLFCMWSSINLGVRHILIVYPLFSIIAAYAVTEWWRQGGAYRFIVSGLIAWQLVSSGLAHPDYLAYFNELSGGRPERILLDSDLDWGQDLHRASIRLRELGARTVAVSYFGTARLNELPAPQELTSCDQHADWALVSVEMLAGWKRKIDAQGSALDSCIGSRKGERVGKSIFLYRLPPGENQ